MQLKNVCLFLPLSLLAACAAKENASTEAAAPVSAEQVLAAADSVSFSSDIADINSASRKVIRTADFRCRVNDVFTASTQLENLVKATGGIVQSSRMNNEGGYTQNVYYKEDSVKRVQAYTTTAYLTLRVPAAALDSVVKAIPQLSAFIEHRTLSQEDLTLKYLSNSLKNKVNTDDAKALALAKKSKDAIVANDYNEAKQERNINRSIENLQLLDNANYATIQVEFYQPEMVNTQVVINPEYFAKPSYTLRLGLALSKGWQFLRGLFIVLLGIWPMYIIAALAWVGYKRFRKLSLVKSRI